MALQIRRGLNQERLAITPANGELIFVTDHVATEVPPLWIGDGITIGGVVASSTGDAEIGPTGPTGPFGPQGDSIIGPTGPTGPIGYLQPQLDQNLNLNGYEINGPGLINIDGSVAIGTRNDISAVSLNNISGVIDTANSIDFRVYGGSIESPVRVAPGEYIDGLSFTIWEPAIEDALTAALIRTKVDENGASGSDYTSGKIEFITFDATNNTNFLTFDSLGQLAVNQETAQATVDINGVLRLAPQAQAPENPVNGMIAIADGNGWDPAGFNLGSSYPVYYNGSIWTSMI